LPPGVSGQLLRTGGASANPSWYTVTGAGTVTSVDASGGTTGMTFTGGPITVSGTLTMSGTLATANGGTGFTTYAAGDLIYASAINTLSKLTAGTNGYVLTLASGVPTWAASAGGVTSFSAGSTGLTPSTATTGAITLAGTLAVANGGTNTTATATANGVTYGTGTAYAFTAAGTTGQVLIATTSSAPSWGQVSLTAGVTGTLPIANGGTNSTATATAGGIGYGTGTAHAYTAAGTSGQVLTSNGVSAPTWASAGATGVTSVASTFTGGIVSVSGTPITSTGTLAYTVAGTSGGIPYFSSGTTWATSAALTQYGVVYGGGAGAAPVSTAAGTAGYALIANSAAAPTFQQVSLTAGVTGVLPAANGGTGVNNSTNTLTMAGSVTHAGAFTQTFTATGNTSVTLPTSGTLATTSNTVASFSGGTTGLTPSSATTGAVSLAGTLIVGNGGTGATTLTGVLKGNGTSAFTAATAGTDYVAPGTATTFTATQTFNGSSSVLASVLVNAAETMTISATAATGTINYDVTTQSVLYYTTSASANWTVNFRASSGTSLNTAMSTGQSVTVAFLVTQGSTAYYNNAITVDGTSVTPKYQGGTAWSAGNASGVDIYTYTIVKTGSAAFTIFASQTQFK